jgi:hypothetical protein
MKGIVCRSTRLHYPNARNWLTLMIAVIAAADTSFFRFDRQSMEHKLAGDSYAKLAKEAKGLLNDYFDWVSDRYDNHR